MVLGIRNCPVARLHILNRCGATVTDGWCPTAALRTGAATVRPVCCFGLRGRTAPPRCCCSTARCGAIRAAPGACRAVLETARDAGTDRGPRIERGGGPVRRATRGAGHGGHRRGVRGRRHALDLHHRCRRCRGVAGHRAQPGKRRTALGGRERGGRLAVTSRIRRQLATTADRSGDRATGPVRRTAAAAAAHHSDRGRGFPLVYAGRRGSGALAAG